MTAYRSTLALACAVSLACLLSACQAEEEGAEGPDASVTASPSASSATSASVPADVILAEAVGVEVAWLESKLGPARTVNGAYREYAAGGCTVRVRAEGGTIQGFAVPLTPACSAQALPALKAYDLPQTLDLTFGQFAQARAYAKLQSDCLHMCGNAADPWIYLASPGPRVSPGIRAGAAMVDDATIDASFRVRDAIRAAEGEAYLIDARFNCTDAFNAVAARELAAVRVAEIEVGYQDIGDCG